MLLVVYRDEVGGLRPGPRSEASLSLVTGVDELVVRAGEVVCVVLVARL